MVVWDRHGLITLLILLAFHAISLEALNDLASLRSISLSDNEQQKSINCLNSKEYHARAQRKRKIANILRKSAADLKKQILNETNGKNILYSKDNPSVLKLAYEELSDLRRVQRLESDADYLEAEARSQVPQAKKKKQNGKQVTEDSKNRTECNILKIGPLEFVPTMDEVRDRLTLSVAGNLDGEYFTIYQNKVPKVTYLLSSIQLPIFNVPDTDNTCWGFKYHGTEQILCSVDIISRDSWMDSLTEAWFCKNEGIKGLLPSIKDSEAIESKAKKTPPKKSKPSIKEKHVMDINLGVDSQGDPVVTINGKKVYGEKSAH